MTQRETTKVLQRAEELGIDVARHRYGNRREWCVEFYTVGHERTVYTRAQANEYLRRFKRGELTTEHRQMERVGWALVDEAKSILGQPPATPAERLERLY